MKTRSEEAPQLIFPWCQSKNFNEKIWALRLKRVFLLNSTELVDAVGKSCHGCTTAADRRVNWLSRFPPWEAPIKEMSQRPETRTLTLAHYAPHAVTWRLRRSVYLLVTYKTLWRPPCWVDFHGQDHRAPALPHDPLLQPILLGRRVWPRGCWTLPMVLLRRPVQFRSLVQQPHFGKALRSLQWKLPKVQRSGVWWQELLHMRGRPFK